MSLICRPLSELAVNAAAGGKALGLKLASDAGLKIPVTWVVHEDRSGAVRPEPETESEIPDLSDDLIETLRRWALNAGATKLAVRSSAQAEDGCYVSFAGQGCSQLRVPVESEALKASLRAVFAGVRNPGLKTYAEHFGISLDGLRLSIVVQTWIEATVAGVAFSLNPLTGERRIVVEAVAGTAEALMDGTVEGKRYLLPANPGETPAAGEQTLLSEAQLQKVQRAVERLERQAGWPVDVEWAFKENELFILQVRPVTAFAVPPAPGIAWSRELTAERYPRPLSPLGWTNIKAVFEEGVRSFAAFMGMPLDAQTELAAIDDGWVVANPTAFDFKRRFRLRLEAAEALELAGATIRYALQQLWGEGLRSLMSEIKELMLVLGHSDRARTRLGNRCGRLAHLVTGTALTAYLQRVSRPVREAWPEILKRFRSEVAAVDDALNTCDDPREIIRLGDRLRNAMIDYVKPDLVIFAVKEIASLILRESATLCGVPNPERVPALLGEGHENCTLRFHEELRRLREILGEPAATEDHQSWLGNPTVKEFLDRFGHQTTSWDIMNPTLGEQPERLVDLLRLSGGDRESVPCETRNLSVEQEHLMQQLGRTKWQRAVTTTAREIMRTFMSIDEEHHFFTGIIIPVTRRLVLKIGRILTHRRVLGAAEEVFWLTDGELREALLSDEPRSRVPLARQRAHAWRQACRRGPPREPKLTSAAADSHGEPLSGLGVSRGIARGSVRRIGGLSDLSTLQPGDVMVVRSPDPALAFSFGRLAALISETGAQLSHGAVAAREYNLPAVFCCRDAFSQLSDGEMVEVDGSSGVVTRLESTKRGRA